VKNQLVRALRVEPAEGAKRMRAMRRHLFRNDLDHWAGSFFDALRGEAPARAPDRKAEREARRGQPRAQA
jgi:trehalose 6-phosphate synthase